MPEKWITRAVVGVLIGAAVSWVLRLRVDVPSPVSASHVAQDAPGRAPTLEVADPAAPQSARSKVWLAGAIATLALGITAGLAALYVSVPDWARWVLLGLALTAIVSLLLALLLGPGARRLAGERGPLSDRERHDLSANERIEAVNAARHTLIQAATGLVVIGGVVFTGQGLWYTAQTLDTARQSQALTEQGQITDRYAKAVEQLGSGRTDVRLGGIYALERLAKDSPRDHQTICDVLTTFIREHHPAPKAELPAEPAADIQGALTVLGRRNTTLDRPANLQGLLFNLKAIRAKGATLINANFARSELTDANLSRAALVYSNLAYADLTGADLTRADLTHANLTNANFAMADLSDADLSDANLFRANLSGATMTDATMSYADLTRTSLVGTDLTDANVSEANLTGRYMLNVILVGTDLINANLSDAYLYGADLTRADLTKADLTHADLTRADLTDADLTGADLRGVTGLSEAAIRKVAKVDSTTLFGPAPEP